MCAIGVSEMEALVRNSSTHLSHRSSSRTAMANLNTRLLSRTAPSSLTLQRRIATLPSQPHSGKQQKIRLGFSARKLHIRSLNTFLPYSDFERSVECLDNRRLGKQRVEAWQILRIVKASPVPVPGTAWANAPAVRMWRGYPDALAVYYNFCLVEWDKRGFKNVLLQPAPLVEELQASPLRMPPWLGDEQLHASHRSNLLRKEPEHYTQFGWTEPPTLPYVWPVPITNIVCVTDIATPKRK